MAGLRGRASTALRNRSDDLAAADQQRLVTDRFAAHAQRWEDLYERADLFSVIHQERHARALGLIDRAALPPGSPVLEIGPGAGLMTVALATRGYQVAAVEAAPQMIRIARSRAQAAGVPGRIRLLLGDGCQLPFPAAQFALVVALGVVPWLSRAEDGIGEMARVLRPGGFLVVNADNRYRLNNVLDPRHHPALDPARAAAKSALSALRLRHQARPGAAVRAHRIGHFDRLVRGAGLHLVASATFGFGPFTLLGLPAVPGHLGVPLCARLQRLADGGAPVVRSGGNQYLVLAKRPEE
jgi:ubiquinone/menaquinone biosynthesis C-methylase UbiE